MSRPSIETPEILEEFIARIISGEAIYKICQDESMPTKDNIYRTVAKNPDIATSIARAKVLQQDAIIEDCRRIADNATPEDVQVAKLQIWQRQWEAARLNARKYGDKLSLGGDKDNPLQIESAVKFYLPDNGRD
jgi:hypothetical protein